MVDSIKLDGMDGECFEVSSKDDEFVFTSAPDSKEVGLLLPAVCAAKESASEPVKDLNPTPYEAYDALPREDFTMNYEQVPWEY